MRGLGALALAAALALPGGRGAAHPHVFIDAALPLVFDEEGRLAALRIDWTYDAFYSLVMIEDNGLDADGDGTPERARLAAFAGQDVDWAAGFPGDVELEDGGVAVALAGPADHGVRYESGRSVTTHVRPLKAPLEIGGPVEARVYDPGFFVAYDMPALPDVEGRRDCSVARRAVDADAAYEEYGEKLAAVDIGGDPFAEVDLGDIGILFADTFEVTCPAPS